MFIQTERTPNPATLKFLPGQSVMPDGQSAHFSTPEAAQRSPLAQALFAVEGVSGVFFGADFISVTKAENAEDWSFLKAPVLGAILNYYMSGMPLFHPSQAFSSAAEDENYAAEDEDIVIQIKELLDSRIRPAVARDGGDISFHGFREGIVYLHMQGSCAGCPSSTATLKNGIETLLKHYVPEVIDVRAI
jgi:Fe-S cluster biogenesis protein NfuA